MAEATMPYVWAGCPRAVPGEDHFPCRDCRWKTAPGAADEGRASGQPTSVGR